MAKNLTDKQISLIEIYAKKARIDPAIVIEWVREGKTTIKQLSKGILGTRIQ